MDPDDAVYMRGRDREQISVANGDRERTPQASCHLELAETDLDAHLHTLAMLKSGWFDSARLPDCAAALQLRDHPRKPQQRVCVEQSLTACIDRSRQCASKSAATRTKTARAPEPWTVRSSQGQQPCNWQIIL